MQEKIVIQLTKNSLEDQAKARQIATKAAGSGNVSVRFEGDRLVVIGNFDPTALTKLLKKRVDRRATLESMGPATA